MKNIGGQAVIEGVMMKGSGGWSVAVRDRSGAIHLKTEPLRVAPKFLRLPFIRGVAGLIHALTIGIRALEFSAGKAYNEDGEKPMSGFAIGLTIALSIIIGICLFILLPLYATKLAGLFVGAVTRSSFVFNLVDGIVRVSIFLLYIFGIGLWKDMRRVFEYHGAEHKVIHAYEAGKGLDAGSAAQFSPHHPRCGTSFLLIVMVISILVFSVIPQTWPFWAKFASRIVFIPAIAGISYEILRLSSRMKNNPLINILIMPGLMLQKLTTREPDALQIEVAISALSEVLKMERADASEA